ncbi:MAG: glucosamine kinase [Propionibacteriaceae bacterium]|jgi:glucosamine kinase|nr:hypothetical protein [Propionibacteriaceae bacterium]MDX6320444.1 glucosamine kinase [Propionibacteriaceae bacterium]
MEGFVIGADIGGTSTRVAVCNLTGAVLGSAIGGPGNPNSVGLDGSAGQIRHTILDAWADAGLPAGSLGAVRKVVIGLAGGSRAADTAGFLRAAVPSEVQVAPALVSDLAVAFCSATPATEGYVLVAGTGAVAGRVVGDDLCERRDGWGWLLGDDGSGFWLGRAAVRSTLAGLEQNQLLGPLGAAVLELAGCADQVELLRACYSRPPAWLAQFSTLVSQHAATDPAAARIAAEAVRLLRGTLMGLEPCPHQPVVLAGSVLTQPGPVSDSLRAQIERELPNPILTSGSGLVGALWMGLRGLGSAPTLHPRLAGDGRLA